MDIDSPRQLLKRHRLSPRRSLGQNFLVDPGAPARIAECAELTPQDTVLEVGAGLGTLTVALAARAGHVIAVETDPHLMAVLTEELGALENVSLVHGDILELDPAQLLKEHPSLSPHAPGPISGTAPTPHAPGPVPGTAPTPHALSPVPGAAPARTTAHHDPLWGPRVEHYQVVANLPYYITAAVIRHLLEAAVRPARMALTVQREVAQRIVAGPGDMSLLAVGVQFYGEPTICLRLKRGAFYPVPKVESAVVRLDLYEEPPVAVESVAQYFRVVQAGFSQRRKQLRNSLAGGLHLDAPQVGETLEAADLDPTRRAETLTIEEWGAFTRALAPLLADN